MPSGSATARLHGLSSFHDAVFATTSPAVFGCEFDVGDDGTELGDPLDVLDRSEWPLPAPLVDEADVDGEAPAVAPEPFVAEDPLVPVMASVLPPDEHADEQIVRTAATAPETSKDLR